MEQRVFCHPNRFASDDSGDMGAVIVAAHGTISVINRGKVCCSAALEFVMRYKDSSVYDINVHPRAVRAVTVFRVERQRGLIHSVQSPRSLPLENLILRDRSIEGAAFIYRFFRWLSL